ncbi:uncharacterized protein KGF55_002711 [Candida pseudojiufengensis]|uniref:uncharacterized protein n=1 Tax=Candida pseudojiufengensis TaxID=497109 RepID=UPI0022244236|nr:uncharacterized protein KGF55_002711 [Candida pseudojiufengensis]KAI5962919.1 hypothetical protein KGF55_002711 [Candida pseudojiufengensis]
MNANLLNLKTLILSSHRLDLDSIDVSNLQKLIICTDIANDQDAIEIAKLYLKNPTINLSWWPRWMKRESTFLTTLFDLQLFTPDYFQIISCQWPSFFFKDTKISIKKKIEYVSKRGRLIQFRYPKLLTILLKEDYSLQDLRVLGFLYDESIYRPVKEILENYENRRKLR